MKCVLRNFVTKNCQLTEKPLSVVTEIEIKEKKRKRTLQKKNPFRINNLAIKKNYD